MATAVAGAARPPGEDVLAAYRAARAQRGLFDVRDAEAGGYDEFVDEAGDVRPAWREVADGVADRGRAGLDRLRSTVRNLVDQDGITGVGPHGSLDGAEESAPPGAWHLDALPLVLSAADWDALEAGLVQRSRILDAVLTDVYGARRCLTSGVLPPQLLFAHPG